MPNRKPQVMLTDEDKQWVINCISVFMQCAGINNGDPKQVTHTANVMLKTLANYQFEVRETKKGKAK